MEVLSKFAKLHGHGFLIMDPDAVYEYIKYSGLYSSGDQGLMKSNHAFWLHKLVESTLGVVLNPNCFVGFLVPILSWAHLARTAAYLFKCFPFSFFGVYWLRDNEDVLLNYFGRLFRMGTAFCLSCFVPWLAGRLPDSRHCSPTSYRQDILSLAELSKRYRVPGCTISRTR